MFSVGGKVTIGIPKMDRAKTDMPRLPCEITEVFGDKVKTYRLATMFGTIKGNFRGGDLQSYDGSVAVCVETLLYRFVKQPRNLIHLISSPNPAANVQMGARQIGASVEKTEYSAPPSVIMLQFAQTLKCQHRHQERHYCHQLIEQYLTKLDG